jgi:hypothetical protein
MLASLGEFFDFPIILKELEQGNSHREP